MSEAVPKADNWPIRCSRCISPRTLSTTGRWRSRFFTREVALLVAEVEIETVAPHLEAGGPVPPVGGAIEPHHGLRRPARGGQVPDRDTLVACTPTHEVDRPPIGRPRVPTEAPSLLPGQRDPSCQLDGTLAGQPDIQVAEAYAPE